MKTQMRAPKTTRSAIIRPSFHGYLAPPHCNANKTQMIAGMKIDVPGRSNSESCSLNPVLGLTALGALKQKSVNTAVTSPKGRLM